MQGVGVVCMYSACTDEQYAKLKFSQASACAKFTWPITTK